MKIIKKAGKKQVPVMTIPEQLKTQNARFLKVASKSKIPVEKGWQLDANYAHDSATLHNWLAVRNGNYGILPRDGLCILDIDNLGYFNMKGVPEAFSDTFQVKTGGGGLHIYIRNNDLNKKISLFSKGTVKEHVGDFFGSGCSNFVVGPGSVHPNGQRYIVVIDKPIKKYSARYLETNLFSKVDHVGNRGV